MMTDVGNSISALTFFEGRLYAADYSKKCLWYFGTDGSGAPDMNKPIIIAEGAGAEIVDLVRVPNLMCVQFFFNAILSCILLLPHRYSRCTSL